jgi:hypothetical protein
MHCTARIVGAAWLVVASACSDDGLTVQNQNSSSTAASDSLGDSSGESPVSGDGGEQGGSASGGSGTGNTADPDSATASETGLDTGPPGGTTDLSGTTDDAGGTTDATSGTTDATSGSTDGASSSEGSTTGEPCQPITEDPSGIGTNCRSDVDCLPGYTCQPFEGFVFQQTCQILCTLECECPAGLACLETADKSGAVWYQCG